MQQRRLPLWGALPAGRPGGIVARLSGTGRLADDLYLMAHHEVTGKPYLQPRAAGPRCGTDLAGLAEMVVGVGGRMLYPGRPAGYSKRTLAGVVMRPSRGSVTVMMPQAMTRPVPIRA
jgi:hypothetical protein